MICHLRIQSYSWQLSSSGHQEVQARLHLRRAISFYAMAGTPNDRNLWDLVHLCVSQGLVEELRLCINLQRSPVE